MLRHLGIKRTYRHNVKLAALLSLTAGFVNAAGFLAFSVLTTNVTGHAAIFAGNIARQDWKTVQVVAFWMFLFLTGAFVSSLIVSLVGTSKRFSYVIPILIELVILLVVALTGYRYNGSLVARELYAGSLLFVMGLQNALVSMISGSVVRTTHLTGTFTDLGIDLAQFMQKGNWPDNLLRSRIKLRLTIILFFLFGAVLGAYLYNRFHFHAFLLPVSILMYALLYDIFRIGVTRLYRQIKLPKVGFR